MSVETPRPQRHEVEVFGRTLLVPRMPLNEALELYGSDDPRSGDAAIVLFVELELCMRSLRGMMSEESREDAVIDRMIRLLKGRRRALAALNPEDAGLDDDGTDDDPGDGTDDDPDDGTDGPGARGEDPSEGELAPAGRALSASAAIRGPTAFLEETARNARRDVSRRARRAPRMVSLSPDREGWSLEQVLPSEEDEGRDAQLDDPKMSAKAEAFVFGVLADRSIDALAGGHRPKRRETLAQQRAIALEGEERKVAAARVAAESGANPDTVYDTMRKGHRRAMEAVENQCRRAMARGEIRLELQPYVDGALGKAGSPPICELWSAECLVFGGLAQAAVDALAEQAELASRVEQGLRDLSRLYRRLESRSDMAKRLGRGDGLTKSEAKERLEERWASARKALKRAVLEALESGRLGPSSLCACIDHVLKGVGLDSYCQVHEARQFVLVQLVGDETGRRDRLDMHGAAFERFRRIASDAVRSEVPALEAATACGDDLTDDSPVPERERQAALEALQRRVRKANDQGMVSGGLAKRVDSLLELLGGAPVCAVARAEAYVFDCLSQRVARVLTPREVRDRGPLFAALRLVAQGELSLGDLRRGPRRWAVTGSWASRVRDLDYWLAWAVAKLERACSSELQSGRIRSSRHPAIDEIFVRVGGTRICDAWAAE